MKVFAFHLMPYGALDMSYAEEHSSVWLKLPNSYFDPREGHELYNRYLDELELAAALGFDGVCVNEHHQNAYGLMPSPVVMASALARKTGDAKIAILGNVFGLREHPLMDEARDHIEVMFNKFLPKISQSMFVPPGYMSPSSMKQIFAHKATLRGGQTIEDMVERGVIAVGSPDTVRKILTDRHHQAGFDHLLLMPQFGTLPADLTEKNIRLLATEVIPALKALGDDDYRGFEPAAVAAE